MSKNSKLLFLSTTLVAIIIALIGTSYAFFTSEVIGNDTANQTVITSGNLAVTFSDGLEVSKSDMVPGESITKTFSVENTGTNELKYDIYFSEICNLFVNNNDLVYTLTSTNNGYSVSEPTPVPTTPSKLVDSQTIGAGVTQEYTLTITFVNANYDQSNEMGAYFSTKLNINDYKNAEHCSKYNNTVKYYVNNVEVQDIPSNVGYLYSTSSCTNNASITWDNTNWNYAVDYDSSTADSVCSIYFNKEVYTITYNLDGGTNNNSNPSSYTVESDTITLSDPTKEGYTFNGWTGDNTTIPKGSTGNKTYTANWTANTYTVTLNNQSATTSGTSSVTATYGSAMPSITVPSKTGYTFGGYYTSTGGSGTQYYTLSGTSTRNWDKTSNTTLYAYWICNDGISSVNGTKNFSYTGSVQTFYACAGRSYKLEVWGAQGGSYNTTYAGGKGGYSYGTTKTLADDTTLYIYVGGQGTSTGTSTTGTRAGGYNGGGSGYSTSTTYLSSAGGGASDIRINSTSLYARVIVAGGGGGSGSYSASYRYSGGAGGGTSGITGSQRSTSYKAGTGGTATKAGTSYYGTTANNTSYGTVATFGSGGSAKTTTGIAGGGGGWYGGGYGRRSSGGGGSGYVYTSSTASNYPSGCLLNSSYYLTSAATSAGNTSFTAPGGSSETGHAGNGYARITRLS